VARILITGGTGFVGTNIRQRLADHTVRILTHSNPGTLASNEQAVPGSVSDPASIALAADECDTVVHLVAIIDESGGQTFDEVIRQGTRNVVSATQQAGVRRFIHMSALGAQPNPDYPYLAAKAGAEEAVQQSGMDWTIFRPSVIFGPGDGFINVLADLVRKAPILPVVGDGLSKFQPVAVGDVADAFRRAIDDPATASHTYELGGSAVYTYEQMLDLIAAKLGKSPRKVHVPVGLMKTVVSLSSPLPRSIRPPVTQEQLRMLALDNTSTQPATESLIGRRPLALAEAIDYIKK
jgi:uncharacterized protein YbjT (DUF2867 family)